MRAEQETPAITIVASGDWQTLWQEVLLGLEEEGIPWRLQPWPDDEPEVVTAAWHAASRSLLLVGIACNTQKLVVHYRNLPVSAPLFMLMHHEGHQAMRCTGNNAARLVKGLPFR